MGSGWVKNRASVRERMGGAGLGILEGVLGFVLLISQGPGMANESLRISLGWATLALMVVSNLHAVLRARKHANRRRDSEGHRLYTQIKFQDALARDESGVDTKSDGSEAYEDGSPRPPSSTG